MSTLVPLHVLNKIGIHKFGNLSINQLRNKDIGTSLLYKNITLNVSISENVWTLLLVHPPSVRNRCHVTFKLLSVLFIRFCRQTICMGDIDRSPSWNGCRTICDAKFTQICSACILFVANDCLCSHIKGFPVYLQQNGLRSETINGDVFRCGVDSAHLLDKYSF